MSDTPITPELLTTWQALADTVQPCPICKQPPGMTTTGPSIDRGRSQVSCTRCRFETPAQDSAEKAISVWNLGVEDHPIARRVRALEADNARLVAALVALTQEGAGLVNEIGSDDNGDFYDYTICAYCDRNYGGHGAEVEADFQHADDCPITVARAALAHVTSETQP